MYTFSLLSQKGKRDKVSGYIPYFGYVTKCCLHEMTPRMDQFQSVTESHIFSRPGRGFTA